MSSEQTGDVKLFSLAADSVTFDAGSGASGFSIEVLSGIVTMTQFFETAAMLSLFGGNRKDDGSPDNPESYWGNLLESDPDFRYVSRTQNLLESLPLTSASLLQIQEAAELDLAWFISKRIANSIIVEVTIPAQNRVQIDGTIRAVGQEFDFSFTQNWKASL